MGYIYEVWCGRPGLKPGLLITYSNEPTAQKVREYQEKILNQDLDPGEIQWRVWVEKKREGYNELERRRALRHSNDAEDSSGY